MVDAVSGLSTDAPPPPPERLGPGPSLEPAGPPPSPAGPSPLGFDALDDEAVYFVMVDRFADGRADNNLDARLEDKGGFHGGDLAGVHAKLDYLSDLGVSTLWLTPVAEQIRHPVFGAGFRDTAYHGYWPTTLNGVDPRFGTEDELTALVDAAHARGLKVILDVVVNHLGYHTELAHDARWVRSVETATCPPDDEATDLNRCLFGLPDLRTEDPAVRAEVVRATAAWARFGIDGMRIDAMRHVEPELLEDIRREVNAYWKAHFPRARGRFVLVGEWWGAAPDDARSRRFVDDGVVDVLIDFSVHGKIEGLLTGRMRPAAFAHHLEARHRAPTSGFAYFLDSHDVTSLRHRLRSEGVDHRYALAPLVFFTLPGTPVVTWGNEVARLGGEWPENRSDMPWDALAGPPGRGVHGLYRDLIRLRRRVPALRGGSVEVLHAEQDRSGATVVFLRGGDADATRALVAIRVGEGAASVRLEAALEGAVHRCAAIGAGGAEPVLKRAEGGSRAVEISLPPDTGAVWLTGRRAEDTQCIVHASAPGGG